MTIPTDQTTYVDEINKSHGHTIDGDGLANNYAIEPEMYEEDGSVPSELGNRVSVVDIFLSEASAKAAVLEMERKGLRSQQISILAKDYQDSESAINWKSIAADGGLESVLAELRISDHATAKFVEAIEDGKFLLIAIGNDREASQAQHVLEGVGHLVQDS